MGPRGSRFAVRGARCAVRGSRFDGRGSRFLVRDLSFEAGRSPTSALVVPRSSALAFGSRLVSCVGARCIAPRTCDVPPSARPGGRPARSRRPPDDARRDTPRVAPRRHRSAVCEGASSNIRR
ncbi:hypothetical protein C7296_30870 [Burkholderia thailandensis]|nr:hypothetical protein [Burkholderia thailandensis]